MCTSSITTYNLGGQSTILIVEDNPDQWFIIRWALLQCFPGFNFVWITDAIQVMIYLDTCLQEQQPLPWMILTDLDRPDRIDGWNLLIALKQNPFYRSIAVILLSKSSNPEDLKQSYLLRCTSYIVKPTSYGEWLICFSELRQYWLEVATLETNSVAAKTIGSA